MYVPEDKSPKCMKNDLIMTGKGQDKYLLRGGVRNVQLLTLKTEK